MARADPDAPEAFPHEPLKGKTHVDDILIAFTPLTGRRFLGYHVPLR
jgi:hypothetical protein